MKTAGKKEYRSEIVIGKFKDKEQSSPIKEGKQNRGYLPGMENISE
jgi:hypothetical protein